MKTVMIFGTFDLLHPGHHFVIKNAMNHGDRLVVIIARDQNVERIKKKTPKWTEQRRADAIRQAYAEDPVHVVLGDLEDFYVPVIAHKPDVLAFGYDQRVDEQKVLKRLAEEGIRPQTLRLDSYYPEKYKSSLINTDT